MAKINLLSQRKGHSNTYNRSCQNVNRIMNWFFIFIIIIIILSYHTPNKIIKNYRYTNIICIFIINSEYMHLCIVLFKRTFDTPLWYKTFFIHNTIVSYDTYNYVYNYDLSMKSLETQKWLIIVIRFS